MRPLDINITVNITIIITVFIIGCVIGGSIIVHFVKHPEKLEKICALINKVFRSVWKGAEKNFVKYDIQFRVNSFVSDLLDKVPNLTPSMVKIEWIELNQTPEEFTHSGNLVLRMHKSNNQNKNVVNATFNYISYSLLRKAKKYIAKYQKESIDLFVSYKLLEKQKFDLLDHFVQEYLQSGLESDKVADFYDKFFDIDNAGLFFPIFITEMTFLGEKVFGKKRNDTQIFEEVKKMVHFLFYYANRRLAEDTISEYNGIYCKFAIRIIGKKIKIDTQGEDVYIKNLKKLSSDIETIYLVGDMANKKFINSIVKKCCPEIEFDIFNRNDYSAVIKDRDGNKIEVKNYLIVLRNQKITIYHRN